MANGIGERLREARSALGIELEGVAERTKIRTAYLRAMEEDRWDLLPGAAYAGAFLRTYAELLGLDAEALVEEYRRLPEPASERAGIEPAPPVAIPRERRLRLPSPPGGLRPGPGTIAAASVAALLGILLVLGLTADSDEEGSETAEVTAPSEPGGETSQVEPVPAAPPAEATLRLTTTGTVWVCLVDESGRPVIEGVTLTTGEEQGPFRARSFDVTLGNGQAEIDANGEPLRIPAAAEPLGYRITPERARELSPSERPTCV